jgi:lipoprotein LprG
MSPATAAKGDAKITVAGSDVDAPFVVDNGSLYAALTVGNWDDFGPAANIYDPSLILNPDTGLASLLANVTSPKSDSRETINGQDTIKITGTAPVDVVNALVPQLKATQPLPATVWIQENGDHQLVQAQLVQSVGNSIQMTLSNWNAPVQVTKPPVSG